MPVKVAINGFGRIGRNILRAIIESDRSDIEVIAINDLGSVATNAHLLQYDSVHGRFPVKINHSETSLNAGRGDIRVTALRNPADLPWQDVDVALECTGVFTDREKAAIHLDNGATRVLVSAPSKGADKTIVYGVNHTEISAEDRVISNASCTTNCLAPLAKVIHDNFGTSLVRRSTPGMVWSSSEIGIRWVRASILVRLGRGNKTAILSSGKRGRFHRNRHTQHGGHELRPSTLC